MTISQILQYLKKLEKDLVSRKKKIAKEDPFADESRLTDNADLGSEATEQFGHEQAEAMEEETEDALARVRKAMKRVDEGRYGKCVSCKADIDKMRLNIDPTAELCVKCAKKAVIKK